MDDWGTLRRVTKYFLNPWSCSQLEWTKFLVESLSRLPFETELSMGGVEITRGRYEIPLILSDNMPVLASHRCSSAWHWLWYGG